MDNPTPNNTAPADEEVKQEATTTSASATMGEERNLGGLDGEENKEGKSTWPQHLRKSLFSLIVHHATHCLITKLYKYILT